MACVEPPLARVPDGDWACSVCEQSRVHGVSDCLSAAERAGVALRDSCLGRDRRRRKYWFLARRIFVYRVSSLESSSLSFLFNLNCVPETSIDYSVKWT